MKYFILLPFLNFKNKIRRETEWKGTKNNYHCRLENVRDILCPENLYHREPSLIFVIIFFNVLQTSNGEIFVTTVRLVLHSKMSSGYLVCCKNFRRRLEKVDYTDVFYQNIRSPPSFFRWLKSLVQI